MSLIIPLILLTIISASGLILYRWKAISTHVLHLFIALGAGSMLSISLIHIFPEALEVSEYAPLAFVAGFLIVYLLEELLTPHHHDHTHGDHSHEDPHEHTDHVAFIAFIAIFLHTILDGVGIGAGMHLDSSVGYMILLGVALHQIPVSVSLAALLRGSRLSIRTQYGMMIAFALSAALGYILSTLLLGHLDPLYSTLFIALAGGSLLYVATADLLPMVHAQSRGKKSLTMMVFAGVLLMTMIGMLAHHHEHAEGEGHEIHAHEAHAD